jgi:hypothetical protein
LSREAQNVTFSNLANQAAYLLRENTGTSGVVQTAQAAVATLAAHDIPHLPKPTKTSEKLQIVGLGELLSLKLDSSAHSPLRRLRDKTDVVELILRRKLPRDLPVAPVVLPLYIETWDALQAES